MADPCCETCRFSVHRNGALFCRRFPPQVVLTPSGPLFGGGPQCESTQPETAPTDWCGEYVSAGDVRP